MPPSRADIAITSASALLQWAASVKIWRAPVRLIIELPGMPHHERAHWQERLERLHNDCGCSAAAVALLGCFVAGIAYAILIGFHQSFWVMALTALAAAAGTFAVGKLVGFVRSRQKLRQRVGELVQLLR